MVNQLFVDTFELDGVAGRGVSGLLTILSRVFSESRCSAKEEEAMNTQTIDTRSSRSDAQASSTMDVLRGALSAALLGGFLIWGVGFSHIDVLHNAAHDARH